MSNDLVKQARLTALMHADGTPVDSADALLLEMADRIEELEGQVAGLLRQATDNHEALTRAEAAEAKLAKAVEALTPSIKTKAAFMGEFSVPFSVATDWGEDTRFVPVPWTTVKEIMKSIRDFAELGEGDNE